ncbi:MAG: P1 family peptidase [Candidatus Caldatribacteriaceae bacterium]
MDFLVGHREDLKKATGCTVFLFEVPNRAVASVRGGAPGSRELSALAPGRLVEGVDAIVFSGGSAFGLSCSGGVMDFLRERRRGFKTAQGMIPIVAQAVIYDLEVGEWAFPSPEWGYEACTKAKERVDEGSVGAGTGATVGKLAGMKKAIKGGFGKGKVETEAGFIWTFVVTNSLGNIYNPYSGELIAGVEDPEKGFLSFSSLNTTLTTTILEADLSREELYHLAHVIHSALATCIRPFATLYDGDIVFLVSLKRKKWVNYLALVGGIYQSVTEAVLSSVKKAESVANIPTYVGYR